jgi:hypothetical protein
VKPDDELPERNCRYCGNEVTSSKPEVDFCEFCFYSGRNQQDDHAALIELLDRQLWIDVTVWHTGGGCFALGAVWPDGSHFMACDKDGFALSKTDQWAVGFYRDQEDCEPLMDDGDPIPGDRIAEAALKLRFDWLATQGWPADPDVRRRRNDTARRIAELRTARVEDAHQRRVMHDDTSGRLRDPRFIES